jgi:hypothetical protein
LVASFEKECLLKYSLKRTARPLLLSAQRIFMKKHMMAHVSILCCDHDCTSDRLLRRQRMAQVLHRCISSRWSKAWQEQPKVSWSAYDTTH